MATKTLQGKVEQQEALERLRSWVKAGDTVHTILRHVSASGIFRVIDVVRIESAEEIKSLGWNIATALDYKYDRDREGVRISGVGMDMGFDIVYNLGRALYPDGYDCGKGESCHSNDHINVRKERCPICGAENPPEPRYFKPSRGWQTPVCSQACAAAIWHHREGGYALRQKWL